MSAFIEGAERNGRHAGSLHQSIEAAKALRMDLAKLIADYGDEMSESDLATLQDTFDGQTTLDAEIRRAVLSIEEDEILVTGIKARESELKTRRLRLEKRIDATRGLIEQAMAVAEWSTHEMDIGTVALGRATPRLEVDEESRIPTRFWKPADPTLDRSGLTKALRERHKALIAAQSIKDPDARTDAIKRVDDDMPQIDGAHLEIEGVSLTIRRS